MFRKKQSEMLRQAASLTKRNTPKSDADRVHRGITIGALLKY
jgi:hypothetical protein